MQLLLRQLVRDERRRRNHSRGQSSASRTYSEHCSCNAPSKYAKRCFGRGYDCVDAAHRELAGGGGAALLLPSIRVNPVTAGSLRAKPIIKSKRMQELRETMCSE